MNKHLLLFWLGIAMYSCSEQNLDTNQCELTRPKIVFVPFSWSTLHFPLTAIRTGDLVLRHSEGFSSDIFKGANRRETLYSHAGIAIKNTDGSVDVYHMLGGVDNPRFNLKRDSVQAFVSPTFAKSFALYRYDLSDNERLYVDSLVRYLYRSNLQFDMNFDLKTDNKMYCSEFVYKVILLSTKKKEYLPLSERNGKRFVGVDDLYLNDHTTILIKKNYEKSN